MSEPTQERAPFADRLYTVFCDFTDGTRSTYDGLTLGDTLAVVATFDTLDITDCSIEPTP